jgi:hypothetical protein
MVEGCGVESDQRRPRGPPRRELAMSTFSADGNLTITVAVQPFILWVVGLTMLVLCIGFLIGHRFGPIRVVFLPEREKGQRKYWLQSDGSITREQYAEGSSEPGVPLRAGSSKA